MEPFSKGSVWCSVRLPGRTQFRNGETAEAFLLAQAEKLDVLFE